jgi:geranylgeranyl diphosphate synthase type II
VKTGASTSSTTDAGGAMVGWAADRAAIDRALVSVTERYARRLGFVAAPIEYALGSGGKRVRGLLCIAAYRACDGTRDAAPIGAAIEIVHAYSLVHDDLPCMDDDVMRRGRPTAHVEYGVKSATIAGVAMVPLAVRAMLDACVVADVDPPTRAMMIRRIMRASGAGGMVGGQLLDLLAESRSLSIEELETIHRGKTGALIAAAAEVGGMAAGAPPRRLAALNRFGASLGLAFQIMDDVLDLTSTTAALGKTVGRDTELRKSTYPGLIGLAAARALTQRTVEDGRAALRSEGLLTEDLERFASFVVERAS